LLKVLVISLKPRLLLFKNSTAFRKCFVGINFAKVLQMVFKCLSKVLLMAISLLKSSI